jgi:acyl carrier protein
MTLTDDDVRKAIAKTVLNVDAGSLDRNVSFHDLGIDSLDHSSILLELQEVHGLNVPDADLEHCMSIRGIVEYAQTH